MNSRKKDLVVDTLNECFGSIFKHHVIPDNIVSGIDNRFTSPFVRRLMDLFEVQLKMSSSQRSQTDASSEIMKRMEENYLRCH